MNFPARSDYLAERIALVASKRYTYLFSYFIKALRLSRVPLLKRNAWWIGSLQLGMLKTLPRFQEELRDRNKNLRNADLANDVREGLSEEKTILEEQIRVVQTITDGVAWRALSFNRPIIRLLSENDSPGHITPEYATILSRFVSSPAAILLANDLTRYLRIGDLTHISRDGGIILYELKRDGDKVLGIDHILREITKHGHRSVSRQRHRHLTAQMSIATRSIEVPVFESDGAVRMLPRAEIVDSRIAIKTHIKSLRALVKAAPAQGMAYQELEKGYFVRVIAWDEIARSRESMARFSRTDPNLGRPSWTSGSEVIPLSSLDAFVRKGSQFPRNFTPQSVLPFSARDCVRLMMGCLEIETFFDLNALRARLETSGWKVKELDISALARLWHVNTSRPEDFMPMQHEGVFALSRQTARGHFNTVLPLTLIIYALSSYYTIDFLIDATADGLEMARESSLSERFVVMNYVNERKVLV